MSPRPRNPGRIEIPPHWLGLEFLLGGGFHVIREPIGLERHAHTGWELTYLEDGEVTWETAAGRRLRLRGGEFALIQPAVVHAGELAIIRPCTLYWVVFNLDGKSAAREFPPGVAAAIATACRGAGDSVRPASPELRAAFAGLRRHLPPKPETAVLDPLDEEWLRTLLRQIVLAAAQSLGTPALSRPALGLATAAERFMRENLHREIGVAEIACAAGVSPARFSARFKRETGVTPADFLRRLRCERAREMLRTSQRSVTDIAFRLGFRSSQHFARVFRRYAGCSPRRYRAGQRVR